VVTTVVSVDCCRPPIDLVAVPIVLSTSENKAVYGTKNSACKATLGVDTEANSLTRATSSVAVALID